LACNLHIKLVNTIAIASLGYRMQFIIFEKDMLIRLQKWIINKLSKIHKLNYKQDEDYWFIFKGLYNLQALNMAIYISNLHKNLNKPNLIGYDSISKIIGPNLNGYLQTNTTQSFAYSDVIKQTLFDIKIDIISTQLLDKIETELASSNTTLNELQQKMTFLSQKNQVKISAKLLKRARTNNIEKDVTIKTETIIIFTDGSLEKNRESMGSALIIGEHNSETKTFEISGPLNSLEPELQAIEIALLSINLQNKIIIVTDSKSAISLLINFHHYKTSQVLKTTNRTTARRIFRHITKDGNKKFKQVKSLSTQIDDNVIGLYHLHSHLIENTNKANKHKQIHEQALGQRLQNVLKKNQMVDKAASEKTRQGKKMEMTLLQEGNDLWQLMDRITDEPIFKKVKNTIYDKITETGINNTLRKNKKFSSRFLHTEVSTQLTTLSFKSNNPNHGNIADFMHKVLERSLPTRKRVFHTLQSQNKKTNENGLPPNKANKVYFDPYCLACAANHNTSIMEDTKHIFTDCDQYKHINNQLKDKIIQAINKNIQPSKINKIPCWFTCENEFTPITQAERRLTTFPKELGDNGYIPKAVKQWIGELAHKNNKILIKKIVSITHKHVQLKWKTRCQDHYSHPEINAPFTPPPPNFSPLPSPQNFIQTTANDNTTFGSNNNNQDKADPNNNNNNYNPTYTNHWTHPAPFAQTEYTNANTYQTQIVHQTYNQYYTTPTHYTHNNTPIFYPHNNYNNTQNIIEYHTNNNWEFHTYTHPTSKK